MSVTLKPLHQQTIVITGASSGIGLATARMAADAGAAVVLAARNADSLADAARLIARDGGRAAWIDVDIAEEGSAERIATFAEKRFGGFDTWVNDAAAALYAPLTDVTLAEHRRVFDVGYFGLVQGSMAAIRRLRNRGGALINIGSVLSERAVPLQGAYSAMKHAVRGYTDALRMDLEREGAPISVTLIKPTGMNTPYPEHARNKMDKPARIPPVVYDPRLVAKAICFCAAHPRRELTVGGQGLMVNKMSNLAPRAADLVMESFFGENAQTIDTSPEPGTSDNLFEPRRDGRVESNQDIAVRRSSLWLEAQMRPWTATAAVAGSAAVLAGAALSLRRKRDAAPRVDATQQKRPPSDGSAEVAKLR